MLDPNTLRHAIEENVTFALTEDIGDGDKTAALIAEESIAFATVICREPTIVAGKLWFDEVFRQLDPSISIDWHYNDGDSAPQDAVLCELRGPARAILSGERAALNFLQTLSATATRTRQFVDQLKSSDARVLDTRKTLPGLRIAQKYAVHCGGGSNHRIGLFDAILIKENHIISCGSIQAAVDKARNDFPQTLVEVEVESIDELNIALAAQVDQVLLDNFSIEQLKTAVALKKEKEAEHIKLEASGNVNLNTIADIAATGVDYISVGALTKHIAAIDLSMRFSFSDQ